MMPRFSHVPRSASVVALLVVLLLSGPACAAPTAVPSLGLLPVLWAKSWMIGYALLFLCILLGMLATLLPSMRKVLRKRDV
ncbi:MAG: hypothetical protein MUF48_17540 [Pirellulaceae bacterium]|nr:hypothetical protein [Pirellulaceae bacterium]